MAKLRVVCLGRDFDLLRTRLQVLAQRYDAVEVSSLERLESLCAEPALRLAVLCHTLSLEECDRATEVVRQRWPGAKVMALITGFHGVAFERADVVVMSSQGPAALLRAIDQLLRNSLPPSSSPPLPAR